MIAAYKALLGRHTSALCAVAVTGLTAWFLAESIALNFFPQSDLTALKWQLFIALAFVLEALIYVAWKTHKHYTSTVAQLRKAIRANELDVRYQPIVDLITGNLLGAESLSRWRTKEGVIAADAAAGKSDLMCELTRSVIHQVAQDYSTYLWACKDFYVTVNLCAQDILDQSFPDFVSSILATYNLPASAMVFEVSETALSGQICAATQLHRLRASGHRIAMAQGRLFSQELPVQALARRYFQCPPNIIP